MYNPSLEGSLPSYITDNSKVDMIQQLKSIFLIGGAMDLFVTRIIHDK